METKNSVTLLKGIGPKYANALKKLDISTVEDFLFFYPNSYEDRRSCKRISDLAVGETALIRGKITHVSRVGYGYGKKRNIRLTVADESGSIEIVFFNSTYLARTLDAESKYEFYGKVTARVGHLQMVHPDYNLYHEDQNVGILPIYPLTKGITQNNMRKWVKESLNYLKEIEEHLPEKILIKHRLCDIKYAIENIHFPEDFRKSREAAFRLIFDELFIMQLGLLSIRRQIETDESSITFSPKIKTKDFISILPYKLTDAQSRVISEIEVDMEASKAMNRLVQGDVGSGKTVVAAAAAFKAIKCGYQVLMMAPTELLAQQHYDSLNETFERFQIKVGLLTGSMTRRQRNAVLGEISKGAIDFIIGTHALIQPDIEYANVGLVITDEQHRFGVNQRNLLSMKGENPDVLVMTATPIPRTLAVILYGDLDHSVIDEMPMGRKPILTKVVSNRRRNKAYEFLETQVKNGRQAYIVAPLIEDSEHIDVKSAVQVYEDAQIRFKNFNVRLLHGNMKQSEKDSIMEEFYSGTADILVSTVVIEVGINVPNATIMLIESAERFGLATLHQLRGRVGRGEQQSYCVLISDSKNEIAQERAKVMAQTNDGFLIAEKDLKLRGPGEFFGLRQHGIPQLRIADLSKHLHILETVRSEAKALLDSDPLLNHKKNLLLKEKVCELYKYSNNISI